MSVGRLLSNIDPAKFERLLRVMDLVDALGLDSSLVVLQEALNQLELEKRGIVR